MEKDATFCNKMLHPFVFYTLYIVPNGKYLTGKMKFL